MLNFSKCIKVKHLNMTRYLEMLKSAEFRDDLDVVSAVHTPKGKYIHNPGCPCRSYKVLYLFVFL